MSFEPSATTHRSGCSPSASTSATPSRPDVTPPSTTIRRPLCGVDLGIGQAELRERGDQFVLRTNGDRVADHRQGVDVDDRVRRCRRRRLDAAGHRDLDPGGAEAASRSDEQPAATTTAAVASTATRAIARVRSCHGVTVWRLEPDVARHRAIGHARRPCLQPAATAWCARRRSSTAGWTSAPSRTIDPTVDDGVARRDGTAPQPRLDRVGDGPGERRSRSDQTATSPTAPRASTPSSPVRPRHAAPPRVAISRAIRAVPAAAPSRSLASSIAWRASNHIDALSADDEPSTPSPTWTPAARSATTGASPDDRIRLLDGQWATPTPARPRRRDLVGVGHHAVGEPRPVRQPAGALEVVRRPAPERRHRELVVLGVLGEVGVQPHVEALGELGGAHHQRLGDGERRARCEGDPRHRAVAAIVMTGDGVLAGGEDVVVVGHDVVGRQATVLDRQRHRAARRVEAHAEVAGGVDLGGEEVAGPVGMEVQVVGRRRAARQRQLGEPDPRRQVGALRVERPPDRVQRLQPAEQRLVRHRRERPRQVLEQVVVGVHEPRRDEAVGRIDRRVAASGAGPVPTASTRPSVIATQPPAQLACARRPSWRQSGR